MTPSNPDTNAVTNYQQSIYKMSNRSGVLFSPLRPPILPPVLYGTSFNTRATPSYSAANEYPRRKRVMNVELGAKIDSGRSAHEHLSFALFRGVKLNGRSATLTRCCSTSPCCPASVTPPAPRPTIVAITLRWEVFGSYTWIWDAEIGQGCGRRREGAGRRPSLDLETPGHPGAPTDHREVVC